MSSPKDEVKCWKDFGMVKATMILFLWRLSLFMLIPFLLPLCAFRKISMKQIWNPLNTSMLFIPLIFNVYLPMVDNGTDVNVGLQYRDQANPENDNPWFSSLTIFFIFLPFFIRIIIEIKNTLNWMIREWELFVALWDKILLDQALDLFSILPFISSIFNFEKIISLSQVKDGYPEAENIQLKMGSHSSWEPFLESLPQFVLQLYVSIQTRPGVPLLISIIISLISLSIACSSSFLLERIKYPVARSLIPKLFLSIIFLFVVIPRVSNIAIFFYICMKASILGNIVGKVIAIGLPIVIIIVLKIAISFSTKNLNGTPILDDITKEYEENKEDEFKAYFKELETKAIILSMFIPCITVSEESMIFPISVGITTLFHLATAGFSWAIFETDVSFQEGQFNATCFSNNSEARNTSCSQVNTMNVDTILGISGHIVFPIMIALLLLSCGALVWLSYLSSHINLRKLLKKLRVDYNHGGVIASIVEKYRLNEFEMEKAAKNMDGLWTDKLDWLKTQQDTTEINTYDLLTAITKEDVNLSHPVVTKRTSNGIISETPIDMIEHNRYKQDYLVSVWDNVQKHEKIGLKNQVSEREHKLEIHEAIKQKKDLSCLYTAIKNTTNINAENGEKMTALMLAIQESATLLHIRLLLYLGSSISYNNSVGTNAFEVALEHANEETMEYLWKRMLKEKEHHKVFVGLCKKDNIEGVEWCLKHTPSDKEMKKLIEKRDNIELEFPLLSAVRKNNTNEISLLLIKEHKRLNPAFLTTCDANGYNILIYAAYKLDSGRLEVLNEVVDIFKDAKKLDLRENENGTNALMIAVGHDTYESVKFLVDYYKEAGLMSKKSKRGNTTLEIAERRGNEDVISLLKLTLSRYFTSTKNNILFMNEGKCGIYFG